MDSTTTTALLKPRLRLFRRSPSPRPFDTTQDSTPHAGPSTARALFSALHDDEDDVPTPRVHPRPIASTTADPTSSATAMPADTPAARLRALLAREPRSPASSTPAPPPPPSSVADSVSEPSHLGSSTSSVARESLKDIFSRALREPGDTPEKGRFRRNSFDGSSMEITPVVDGRGHRRPPRKSLSDEESDKPKSSRRSSPSFRLSTAVAFDTLRARLMSSHSQLVDQNPPEALHEQSSLASASISDAKHPQAATSSQINQAHVAPSSVAADTPQPSFQMSSQLAFQSNLLEQDSEMQRAMGDVLNSENEDTTASTSASNDVQPSAPPSDSRPTSSLGASRYDPKLSLRRTSNELGASTSGSSVNGRAGGERHSQGEENNHQREREWNRPRLPSTSSIPDTHRRHSRELHHRLSQEFRSPSHAKSLSPESEIRSTSATPMLRRLERRGSLASLRSFDDEHGSRPSSSGSQADYRDQVSELDRERNYGREREWNKRHPPSRPSSSMSTSSNHSFTHAHTHPPRSPSVTPYFTPTHSSLQRKSSRTSLRSDSPTSLASSHDSLREREEEEKKEVTHERERNWNSPRPHWTTTSKSPPSHLKTQNQDNHSLRPTSSLPHLGGSNGHQDIPRPSTKLRASPKADFAFSTSPHLSRKPGDRSDLRFNESAADMAQSTPPNGSSPGKTPGATSRFGWHFPRSPLPPLELDDSENHRRSTSSPRAPQATASSQIPVRSRMQSFSSVGHATSDMSFTHVVGDESRQRDYRSGSSENVEPRSRGEPPAGRSLSSQDDVVLGSDEESINDIPAESTTPKSIPPKFFSEQVETDTETEVLTSPSPQGSPRAEASTSISNDASLQDGSDPPRSQTPNTPPKEQPINATPPGTPPAASASSELPTGTSPSFSLATPPRPMFLGNSTSILDFRTPSPPHDLPDLPAPPLSSDDDMFGGTPTRDQRVEANTNFTLTKTPKPPGAWTATPLPPKYRASSPVDTFSLESTPPAFTSTPLARATTLPHMGAEADGVGEDGLLTPVGSLSRARSLPLRTPAPPGAWMATPAQSALLSNGGDQSQYGSLGRRKGLLKVRFDVAESETSATEGHPNSPLSAIRLVNPELPLPKLAADGEILNGVSQLPSTSTLPQRPTTPERPTTPNSRESAPSPRSLRKSPSVRLVDAFGRERIEERAVAPPSDLSTTHADITTSPLTPRRSLVRIVDAMGREMGEAAEAPDASGDGKNRLFETDVSVVSDDIPLGHAEALARMRKTLKDLAESLSDADRSEDLELNSSHIEQLEEVSQAARLARNQLAHNLHVETAKEHDLRRDHNNKFSTWTRGLLPTTPQGPWSTTIIYCGVIMQILLVLAMWRYAHAEAHRLFYTTYYDPIYPEYTPTLGDSCLSGMLSTSRPWTMFDSYEAIRREGWWSIGKEILRAVRHVADQAWERWGEHASLENPS